MINVKDSNQNIVLKKIILNNYFKKLNGYDDAFHGTSINALLSIAKNGLKKAGDRINGTTIDVVPGHIALGKKVNNINNWSNAVFVSPSIYYAAHPVYSK